MEIRLQLKTHYQINKPGIFSVLLHKCTSLTKSQYPEVISERLAKMQFETIALNKESAKFAVAMAQSFGFVTQNMFWSWKGHAITILLNETNREEFDDYLALTLAEKVLYLKYYLEADGAAILEICKRLKSKGRISRKELLANDSIDQIFIDIWQAYRQLTNDIRQKVQLRDNILKLRTKPYTFKTRIHKALAHIEPLVDFDLIERKEEKNEILFIPKVNKCFSYLDKLTQELDTIKSMESRFSKSEHFEIINSIYNLKAVDYDPEEHSEMLFDEIFKIYLKARTEPTKMASLAMISDVISAKLLAQKRILINRIHIEMELDRLKSDYPRDVHYHVDMSGEKAFLVLSDQLCTCASAAISSLRLTLHQPDAAEGA